MVIPIIDIFAGPGGLGEGFSAFQSHERRFKIALSIEKDPYAHQTLTLRSFFRQFPEGQVPDEYYQFIKGQISLKDLFNKWPDYALHAKNEAWLAELGDGKNATPNDVIDKRIQDALKNEEYWVLIGGPPCQAYSVVGRSRRQEKVLDEQKDERVGLYKQYLRILAVHKPAVFVMENVKGLLSAKTENDSIFSRILTDLANPAGAWLSEYQSSNLNLNCPGYKIYSLVSRPLVWNRKGDPVFNHTDFVIRCEKYGIPQTRHRVILLGIRKDIEYVPEILESMDEVPVSSVLAGLPVLRSTLSRTSDCGNDWEAAIKKIQRKEILNHTDADVRQEIAHQLNSIPQINKDAGGEYMPYRQYGISYRPDWFLDKKIGGVCNHAARGHMESDLLRYFFVSCFAAVKKRSPRLADFPAALLPAHKNVKAGIEEKKFADRFTVQLRDSPCKTITSHISKDGHYYIHPDPAQCRSFTVIPVFSKINTSK